MAESVPVFGRSVKGLRVRIVTTSEPWEWLTAGWRDLLKTPFSSIAYGAIFAVMGYVLVGVISGGFQYAFALITGFMLVAPFLAMGFYELSRRTEKGESAHLGHALTAWRGNVVDIFIFGMLVALLMVVWVRLAALIQALVLGTTPMIESDPSRLFLSGDGLMFLIVFGVIGAVLAALVFSISVVSVPMLMDRKCDVVTAVVTSMAATRLNMVPMLLWAGLIVVFTGVGLMLFFVGLAITLPLIGHATWHAYRSLVE